MDSPTGAGSEPGPEPEPGTDDRGVTPAVGKLLEVGIVVLFVGLVTTVLLGGVVPEYRTAVGAEVGERVLAAASGGIERAVPPTASGVRGVRATREVALPATVRGSGYAIVVDGRRLVLDHPHPGIGGRIRLSLPQSVRRVEGRWQSGARTVVRVDRTRNGTGLAVELRNGGDG